MSKHVQTRSNSCVQILKSENMEQSRVTWVCLQVLSASGWILACFRAHQGPTNCPRCQSSTDPHRKLSNQSRHDENFRGCESWNAQNGCKNDVARRGTTWHDVAWRDTIHCDMMQYDVTSVQLPVVSFCRQPDSFHHSGLLNQIWDSLWWNPKYDENTGLISSRFQFSGIMFFFCRHASARGIRRKAASWAPGVGTQLETRRFARRALHATLRIASKSKGRFQIIWSCWISSDSNMFRDFRVSQGAKHKDDALASLKTLLTPARSVRVQRLGPPKRSKFLLGSSSGALVVRRDQAMSDHQWKIHYDSLSFNFHQVSPSIWLGLWHFDACRSSLPKPDRFKSAASNLARKPEQNKDQLNLVGILWVPPRLVFNCPLSETNVLSRPVDNKTISKHLKASSSVFSWHEKIASTGTSRPIFVSQANSNGLAQSNDRTGESQCHWCCHGRLLLVQFYGGRTHCLSLWPLGTNVQKTAAEYCTNSLAATECGTSWSSIQWTTLLLCFVGVICSFQGERGIMSLPCKGESFCMYNILHFCAKEFWDFTI